MKRKLIVSILILSMIVSVLAACGGTSADNDKNSTQVTTNGTLNTTTEKNEETNPNLSANADLVSKDSYPLVKDKITLKGIMPDNPWAKPYPELKIAQWLEEMTNIKIDMQVMASTAYAEKKPLLLASNDLPDFFFMADMTGDELSMYGEDGTFIDLRPMVENGYAPNFKKLLDKDPRIMNVITLQPSGKLPSMPFVFNGLNEPFITINMKWLDKLGLKEPQTLDEFLAVCKAFRDNDPNGNNKKDEIPISSGYALYWMYPFTTFFGIPGTNGIALMDNKVTYVPYTNEYKEFLKFLKLCYDEKYLDNRIVTQTAPNDEKIMADCREGKVGMIYTAYPALVMGNEHAADYGILTPVQPPNGREKIWPGSLKALAGTFVITKNCKYPEALLRWVDFFYSKEGEEMIYLGKEGETYEKDGSGIWKHLKSTDMDTTKFRGTFSFQGGHYYPGYWEPSIDQNSSDTELRRVATELRPKLLPITKEAFPQVTFSKEETDEVSGLLVEIQGYVEQMSAKFVSSQADIDKDWGTFIKTLDDMKGKKVLEIHNAAYQRYINAK